MMMPNRKLNLEPLFFSAIAGLLTGGGAVFFEEKGREKTFHDTHLSIKTPGNAKQALKNNDVYLSDLQSAMFKAAQATAAESISQGSKDRAERNFEYLCKNTELHLRPQGMNCGRIEYVDPQL